MITTSLSSRTSLVGRSVFALSLSLLTLAQQATGGPVDLHAPGNSLGSSDAYGRLRLWREYGNVDFGKGLSLPLRAEFSSEVGQRSGCFGEGWFVPLLESNVYLQREGMLKATLLCGKALFLREDRDEKGQYHSLDMDWSASVDGTSAVIRRRDGWELHYKNAKIQSLVTDDGRVIDWHRNHEGLVTQMRERTTVRPGLEVTYGFNGDLGSIRCSGKVLRFEMGRMPVIVPSADGGMFDGMVPSLAKVTFDSGDVEEYRVEHHMGRAGIECEFTLTTREGDLEHYAWDPLTGAIQADEEWTYVIGEPDYKFDLPRIDRTNKVSGETEFINVDLRQGTTETKTLHNGHQIAHHYTSPGPLYNKVRKIESILPSGTITQRYAASYDELGRKIRSVDSAGVITHFGYDKEGRFLGTTYDFKRDDAVLKGLQEQEQDLISHAESQSGRARRDALKKLGMFYIHEMKKPEKALELVDQLPDQAGKFSLQLHAVAHNPFLNPAAKIARYKELLAAFPDRGQLLESLIATEQKKHESEGPDSI